MKALQAYTIALWYSVLVLFSLMITGCTGVYTFEEPRRCMAPFVLIVGSPDGYLGSAVAVSKTTAYTAAHVVDEETFVEVGEMGCDERGSYEYGPTHRAKVVWTDPDRDLAFLELTNKGAPFEYVAQLRQGPVDVGEVVYVHGVRTHGRPAIVHDITSALAEGVPQHGDSGGAVIDEKGRLVGIVRAGICQKNGMCSMFIRDKQDSFGRFIELFVGVEWIKL